MMEGEMIPYSRFRGEFRALIGLRRVDADNNNGDDSWWIWRILVLQVPSDVPDTTRLTPSNEAIIWQLFAEDSAPATPKLARYP